MKKNVLVTSTGGRSVGAGILHALHRSSSEVADRWNVIAADANSFAWGLYSVNQGVLLPLATDPDYIKKLNRVVSEFNISAILPGSEAEVSLLSLKSSLVSVPVICNSPGLMPYMMDKFRTTEKLRELNLPYIETFPVTEWKTAVKKYNFPLIIKPTIGSGGSKDVRFVFSKEEIETSLPNLSPSSHHCIQPYIGTGNDEYTVGVLSDKEGTLIDSIVMKRNLSGLSLLDNRRYEGKDYSISTGYSQGYFIKNQKIQSFCENLAVKLESKGPLNIQLRLSGNEIYVFEIHPRFSGTTTMRADVGFNEPDLLLRNFLYNEKFSRVQYQYNVAAIRAFEHIIVPLEKMY